MGIILSSAVKIRAWPAWHMETIDSEMPLAGFSNMNIGLCNASKRVVDKFVLSWSSSSADTW